MKDCNYQRSTNKISDSIIPIKICEITDAIFNLSEDIIKETGFTTQKNYKEAVDGYAAHLILNFLHPYGVMSGANSNMSYTLSEIINIIGIKPVYQRLAEYMLHFLIEKGFLKKDEKGFSQAADIPAACINELFQENLCLFPHYKGTFQLLKHFMKYYPEVLTGRVSPLNVLFPNGSADLLTSFSNANRTMGELIELIAIKSIKHYIMQNSKKPLKILEVGAGLGTVGKTIFPELIDKQVEYYYTDIGRSIVVNAKKQFSNYPFLKFEVFNIEQDPLGQGFGSGEFDIVIALNVIHATRSLQQSLSNIKKVMAPDSVLFIIEKVESEPVENLIWGMTEGWWLYEDIDLRKRTPIVPINCWEKLLQQNFEQVHCYPKDLKIRNESESALLIGVSEMTKRGINV